MATLTSAVFIAANNVAAYDKYAYQRIFEASKKYKTNYMAKRKFSFFLITTNYQGVIWAKVDQPL